MLGIDGRDVSSLAGAGEVALDCIADSSNCVLTFELRRAEHTHTVDSGALCETSVDELRDLFRATVDLAHRCAIISPDCAAMAFHLSHEDAKALAAIGSIDLHAAVKGMSFRLAVRGISRCIDMIERTLAYEESTLRNYTLSSLLLAGKLASLDIPDRWAA